MVNLFRARWYGLVHTLPFWGFLILTGIIAALMTDSTVRFNDAPLGFDGMPFEEASALAGFVLGITSLWFVAFAAPDEKTGFVRQCLVAVGSRWRWVCSGVLCFTMVLLCLTASFIVGIGATLLVYGFAPLVSLGAIGGFAHFLGAFLVVGIAYGCALSLVVVLTRSVGIGVLAVGVLLGGLAESGVAALLMAGGWGYLVDGWTACTLFGQLTALCTGRMLSAAGLACAGAYAVTFLGLAVIVERRRAL